ncbi:hypothetical protein B0H14DRAFT_2580509 [Mycena olivaceomarginata]|nr:hypothetical protein B0H14DRAFT_2580509 [Mycena olivaceomarginata]
MHIISLIFAFISTAAAAPLNESNVADLTAREPQDKQVARDNFVELDLAVHEAKTLEEYSDTRLGQMFEKEISRADTQLLTIGLSSREPCANRAARRARRAGATGSGGGHTVPFRGLFAAFLTAVPVEKRPLTACSAKRQNDGRRVTDCSHSGPVETTAVPVTGTACSPKRQSGC